jgi:hypothetical protein
MMSDALGVGPPLSMTMIWLSNAVPNLAYAAPSMPMFARTRYRPAMSAHQP